MPLNYPTIRPSLVLDFANSRTVDPRITFTRASTATYFDHLGVLRTAAATVPRIDFDPITLACRGLLIEEQRTNLVPYSNDFTNWNNKHFVTLQTGTVAPDGSVATKLVCNTDDSEHFIEHFLTLGDGTYTQSVFVKPAEFTFIRLRPVHVGAAQGSSTSILFNLAAGTVVTPVPSHASAGIIPVGNGWYRCWVTVTVSGITGSVGPRIQLDNGSNVHYFTGDGTSGVYIWGAQFEQGEFPTSYIPTNGTQVTRAADSAVMTGTNFSSWYRQDEGTLFAEASFTNVSLVRGVVAIGDPTLAISSAETIYLGFTPSLSGRPALSVYDAGVYQAVSSAAVGTVTANTPIKMAAAYKLNDFAFTFSGAPPATDTSGTVPTPTGCSIGSFSQGWNSGSSRLNGHIRRIAYWPVRLPNAQLQALSV